MKKNLPEVALILATPYQIELDNSDATEFLVVVPVEPVGTRGLSDVTGVFVGVL